MRIAAMWLLLAGASNSPLQAQTVTVNGTVSVLRPGPGKSDNADAVVWLKPAGQTMRSPAPTHVKIVQQHKRFEPHVTVIPAGSIVDFPNLDPFFHNVFSMFDGKRFDLGLYEAGASHSVTFDRVGVVYIFCNIHPEMSAVVVVTDSPYYAISDKAGKFSIPEVLLGRYLVNVWHERGKPEVAAEFPRQVTISLDNTTLAPIRLRDSGQLVAPHKNKYGHDYDPTSSSGPVYK